MDLKEKLTTFKKEGSFITINYSNNKTIMGYIREIEKDYVRIQGNTKELIEESEDKNYIIKITEIQSLEY